MVNNIVLFLKIDILFIHESLVIIIIIIINVIL